MSLAWFLPLSDGYGWVDVDGVYNFACSLREVLAKHPFLPHGCGLVSGSYFPSFSEGLSLRRLVCEARIFNYWNFPSFSEGLSLRRDPHHHGPAPHPADFPSFSEGLSLRHSHRDRKRRKHRHFPSFSEGLSLRLEFFNSRHTNNENFPSFSEGLSLRRCWLRWHPT